MVVREALSYLSKIRALKYKSVGIEDVMRGLSLDIAYSIKHENKDYSFEKYIFDVEVKSFRDKPVIEIATNIVEFLKDSPSAQKKYFDLYNLALTYLSLRAFLTDLDKKNLLSTVCCYEVYFKSVRENSKCFVIYIKDEQSMDNCLLAGTSNQVLKAKFNQLKGIYQTKRS